ncbi:nitroreductase family protein [Desulfotomaculum copahuensis]|uniref:Oxidoreductase n=1 Tax=Desulfotomaculum copahuensis TaxID=1838280 RepID=A0A1B7LFN1_9FIRM|nr:nitroreductase family protein [Desulfotomaculum copahuensis]OAT82402.1 oxidoreductase [Desulfotomaculum copahuensis]
MEFQELLLKRKSIRKFKPDPVPDEYITGLLEAARLAPSGTNIQPWRFVVVKSREMREKLGACTYGLKFVARAPVTIVCCADLNALTAREKRMAELREAGAFLDSGLDDEHFQKYARARARSRDGEAAKAYASLNVAIAIEHIALRAADLGLGSCWVMMFRQGEVKELLHLGENILVVALLPVGFPDQDPPFRPRLPLSELLLKEV